jgi:peptidoglycan/LPS O-acetylase OafA/YrhL
MDATLARESRAEARSADALYRAFITAPRFRSLDGLRFLSIVPVVWHHSTPRPLEGLLGRGPLGVDLFFAISGFLVTTLLLRERRKTAHVAVTRFYARRALRIFPLYYGVLSLYVLRAWLFLPDGVVRRHFFASLPWYATFTSNWFVDFAVPHPVIFAFAWSVATEEQFYALWPWVVRAARGWWFPVAVAALLLTADQCVEWGLWVQALPVGSLGRRIVQSLSSPLCMGILLACALDRPRSFNAVAKVLGSRAAAPILFAGLVGLVGRGVTPLVATQLVMALLVGACSLRSDHALTWLTDWAPLRFVGRISYGIYLFHVAAVTAAKQLLPVPLSTTFGVFVTAFAASMVVAAVSYRWFERPFLRLGERLRS